MGYCLPRDSSSSWHLHLAPTAPGHAQTTLWHLELWSFPPGSFPVPAWPFPCASSSSQPSAPGLSQHPTRQAPRGRSPHGHWHPVPSCAILCSCPNSCSSVPRCPWCQGHRVPACAAPHMACGLHGAGAWAGAPKPHTRTTLLLLRHRGVSCPSGVTQHCSVPTLAVPLSHALQSTAVPCAQLCALDPALCTQLTRCTPPCSQPAAWAGRAVLGCATPC